MKLDEAELEPSFYESARVGPDKFVGYILVVLIVIFLFSLFVFGMHHVQTVSDQVVGNSPRAANSTTAEIGDSSDDKSH